VTERKLHGFEYTDEDTGEVIHFDCDFDYIGDMKIAWETLGKPVLLFACLSVLKVIFKLANLKPSRRFRQHNLLSLLWCQIQRLVRDTIKSL